MVEIGNATNTISRSAVLSHRHGGMYEDYGVTSLALRLHSPATSHPSSSLKTSRAVACVRLIAPNLIAASAVASGPP